MPVLLQRAPSAQWSPSTGPGGGSKDHMSVHSDSPADVEDASGLGLASGTPPAVLPERLGYRVKRRLLGAPLTNDQLHEERLSKTVALGVLAPDCISSSAYGSEQILLELLPVAALGAFALLLPITGIILVIRVCPRFG